jgi:hypothetical protein
VVSFSDVLPPVRTEPTGWLIWSGRDWLAKRYELGRNCIMSPEVLLRADVQRAIGGYDSTLPHSGDMMMWMKAAAVADIGYVVGADQALYRVHGANMHVTSFGGERPEGWAIDLRERMRTFELAANELRGRLPEADRLLWRARRALAVEALTFALRAVYTGSTDRWPVDDLIDLAAEVYPRVRRLPQWWVLQQRLRRDGHGRPRPISSTHEFALKARVWLRYWRWRRAGL